MILPTWKLHSEDLVQQILSKSLDSFLRTCSARTYSSTPAMQVDSKIRTRVLADIAISGFR